MGRFAWAVLFAGGAFLSEDVAMAGTPLDFFPQLPSEIGGWNKAHPPERFGRESLYSYIDGGAELYLSYDFQELQSVRYCKDKERDIQIDIFDMGQAESAFGVFAHGRERIGREVGQGSEYLAGLLTFWKDRYYISVLAYPESEEKRRVVFRLGAAIAGLIPREGAVPALVSRLPAAGLVPESVKYFRHPVWLNSAYFVSNDNPLRMEAGTEAVLGRYGRGKQSHLLVLVQYPDTRTAAVAAQGFRTLFKRSAGSVGALEDGRFAGVRAAGRLILLVLDAQDAKLAAEALDLASPKEGP